jgi:hypothetical protein
VPVEVPALRLPRVRFSVRTLLAFVAVAASLLGAERLWECSMHFSKQAALCAFFELQLRCYLETNYDDDDLMGSTAEEKRETARKTLDEAHRYAFLKGVYQRIARQPWKSLPPETPASVNPWDLEFLTTEEIEMLTRNVEESRRTGRR